MSDTFAGDGEMRPRYGAGRHVRLDIPSDPTRAPLRPRSGESELPVAPPVEGGGMFTLELHTLLLHLQRYVMLIIALALVGACAAASFGLIVKPRYTVATEILIDPADLRVVSDDLYTTNEQRDALVLNVESRMRVLTSNNVLSTVVSRLNLATDDEFVPSPSWLSTFAPSSEEQVITPPELIALRNLDEKVRASRDERSFVVTLTVTTQNADKSVAISQVIVEAFKEELARADAEGASRTAASLIERLSELKANVNQAEEAVEQFRRENSLQSSGGELVSTLSFTQLNTQLIDAQRRLIEAQSRYEELTTGGEDAVTNAAAQESTILSALRTQYATLKQEADSLSLTLGPLHPRNLAIAPQVAALEEQIAAETARIVDAAETNLVQAQAVLDSLTQQASDAQAVVVAGNSAEVTLRELEREAAAQAAIYEAFLVRARQVTERESINTTNIRVISEPIPPKERSWPPKLAQLVGLGATAGLAIGALLSLALSLYAQGNRKPQSRAFGA